MNVQLYLCMYKKKSGWLILSLLVWFSLHRSRISCKTGRDDMTDRQFRRLSHHYSSSKSVQELRVTTNTRVLLQSDISAMQFAEELMNLYEAN